jgi:type II secretion system protein N
MNRKPFLRLAGYILFFLCLTLVFSFLNYPRENLTGSVNGWLSEVSDQSLSVRNVSFRIPLSLKLGDIAVDMGKNRIVLGDAVVTPLLLPLLTGKKAFDVRLDGPWASSRFEFRTREDGWKLDVDFIKAELDTLPLSEGLPFELVGGAEAVLEIDIQDSSDIRLEGQGQFSGKDIQASGGVLEVVGLSPLRFPSLNVFFTIKDNMLTLNENSVTGDITASARGTVRLVPSRPGSSQLDLTLDIKPGPAVSERLSPLFSVMGARQGPNGSVYLRIKGTINRPRISS